MVGPALFLPVLNLNGKHSGLSTMLPCVTFETHARLETLEYSKKSFTFWTLERYKSLMFFTWLSLLFTDLLFFPLPILDASVLQLFDGFYLANRLYHSYDIKIVWSERIKLNPKLESSISAPYFIRLLFFFTLPTEYQ